MKTASRVCDSCGGQIFGDAPQGLCPACVLQTGLGPLADETVAVIDDPGHPADMLMDFGDYELLKEIGRGGQGVVYRARQKSLNRTVALKVIGLGQWATKAHAKRFRLEAEAAASLDHPCIVPIYEVGEREGSCYFSMKFIEGAQLDEVAKRKPISPRPAAELIAKLARTVHYAHEHGILHRDIKPGNVLIDTQGEPHLTDFGLARLAGAESTLTHTMDVIGTPGYMAPEQAAGRNQQLTSATDVYGLGAVFYQLLTGHAPFAGATTYETVRLVLESEPRQPRLWNPQIDRDLSTICLKCLEKDPQRRYGSALALAEDLERWLRHEPIRARHTGVFTRGRKWLRRNRTTAAFVTVVAVVLASALWEFFRVQEERAFERRAKLSEQEQARLAAEQTNNPAAYLAYLHGRAFAIEFSGRDVENAIRSFQEAVELDPSFALAWARLSCAHSQIYGIESLDPKPERLAGVKDALDHALALAPDLAETHLAVGYYRYYGQHDYAGALEEFRKAEQGLPNDLDVTFAIALANRRLAHWEEAIVWTSHAIELAPRNITAYNYLAMTYQGLRRFPEALVAVDSVLAWESTDTSTLETKASILWSMGDLQAVERLLDNPGISPRVRGQQAFLQRRYAEAAQILSGAVAAETGGRPSRVLKLLLALSQERAGDIAAAHATYLKAAQDFQQELREVVPDHPAEAGWHAALGRAYASLGEAALAIAEGQRAIAIDPTSKDPTYGPDLERDMAQIYAQLGDADHAIPIIRRLLHLPSPDMTPGVMTPALLRLDPVWDPIRNDPRFQDLVSEK
jgi:tetratricopeptide (TPR) repeat protein/predicted Ser/Thr protein kinase